MKRCNLFEAREPGAPESCAHTLSLNVSRDEAGSRLQIPASWQMASRCRHGGRPWRRGDDGRDIAARCRVYKRISPAVNIIASTVDIHHNTSSATPQTLTTPPQARLVNRMMTMAFAAIVNGRGYGRGEEYFEHCHSMLDGDRCD